MKKKLRNKIWDWFTQFSMSYAIATIAVVVVSLSCNGFDKAHVILEFNPVIRIAEIVAGIFSFVVLLINWFIKFDRMACKK